jgi:hypothetical protein
MKVVAVVGVKNEVDLIVRAVEQLLAIGVDLVIVLDYGSDDGTLDVMREIVSPDRVLLVHGTNDSMDATSARKLELVRQAKADWALFTDADEFWIPAAGTLKDVLASQRSEILGVRRFNVPVTEGGPHMPDELSPSSYHELLLCVRWMADYADTRQDRPDVPWIVGSRTGPKMLINPGVAASLAPGDHWIDTMNGGSTQGVAPTNLLIAHLPFTTYERFERKVRSIQQEVRAHPEFFVGRRGWHWKYWSDLAEAGTLREEFNRQILDNRQLEGWMRDGTIRSAADMLDGGLAET